MGKASRSKVDEMSRGKRIGRKELRDALILNIRDDITWIGKKREDELIKYINDKFMKLTYGDSK